MKKFIHGDSEESRRSFLGKSIVGAAGVSTGLSVPLLGQEKKDKVVEDPKAEKLVRELLGSLSEEQRGKVVIPFDNVLRHKIENNWHILRERVGTHFTKEQQLLIQDIFRELHSEEMRDEVWRQYMEDNRGGKAKTPDEIFGTSSVAIFEEPESKKFEFVLTGRHTTRRCDGNATEGVAFGGPIFYGHASRGFNEKADHPGNAYWFQAKRANDLYAMLDGKQQEKALKGKGRGERGSKTVELKGKIDGIEGLSAADMTSDQRLVLRSVVADLLKPFRKEDQTEALAMIEKQLFDSSIAFYKDQDIGGDGVWDNWQLEGPQFVWYFRGNPHVHTWVHVKEAKEKEKKKA